MEAVGNGANAEERAPQQGGKVAHGAGLHSGTLEVRVVGAWGNPDLVGHARRVGTARHVFTANLNDALLLLLLLAQDVAEDATLLYAIVFARGAQLIQNSPRHEGCGDDL